MARTLRHGYTTGACAAAAAKGATRMLREQRLVEEVELVLPAGETARFRLHGQRLTDREASCYVVKDAGDDPDITHGAQVHVAIRVEYFSPHRIVIEGGEGIGRVTKPGLAMPPGAWAINPVPRRMIAEAMHEVLAMRCIPAAYTVTVSIPDGAERARKTLNERLGIVGGLSILGTTGIVRPISAQAWTDTIDTAIDVAQACGCAAVVLSTGRTSELVAERVLAVGKRPKDEEVPPWPFPGQGLPEEAFVMMGDHVGHAFRACAARGVRRIVLAGQFAKLLKIACGHGQTHVSSSELDLGTLKAWVASTPQCADLVPVVAAAHTAREVLESSGHGPALLSLVCGRANAFVKSLAPEAEIKVLLAGYGGEVLYFA